MSLRIATHSFGALACLAALCAYPAAAQDSAAAKAAGGGEPLSQALTTLSQADGFEVRGLDRVGDETVQAPKSSSPVQALRRMLDGYAYTLELAPADAAGKSSGKLIRVSILGHSGDGAGNPAQASAPGSTVAIGDLNAGSATPAADSSAESAHPVTHMLQAIARSSIPQTANTALVQSGQLSGAPAADGSATSGTAAPGTAAGTSASGAPDMAALTRTASGNLSALVQSLKVACPAGAKC